MECNKEEALRAKELAEKKFLERDFAGAKRLVRTAIRLNPSLEGTSQMLPVIDVHIVSQQRVGDGEPDWYGILQVDPVASEAAIRSQYKKLALLFHPDKNKAVGAESAFKLISDAWNVLSDKPKKFLHDAKRRNYQASNVRASSHADHCRSNRQNEEERVKAEEERRKEAEKELEILKEKVRKENEMRKKNEEKEKKKAEREQRREREKEIKRRRSDELKALRDSRERNKKPSSFKILDGIPSVSDLDGQLKQDSFRANELSQLEQLKHRAQRRDAAVLVDASDLGYEQGHEETQEMNSGCQHVPENIRADQVSRGPDTKNQTGKRKNKGLNGDSKEEEAQGRQKRKIESPGSTSLKDQQPEERDDDDQCPVMISREVIKQDRIFAECLHESSALHAVECPVSENLGFVLHDSKIKDKDAALEVSTRMTRSMLREKGKQVSRIEEAERNVPHDHLHVRPKKSFQGETGFQHVDGEMIEVLPSQFHQFDDVRTRQSFRVGQIWAVYDDKDGMPRFYCRLKRVSRSSSPFKAHLSWLEPTTQTHKRHLNTWGRDNSFAVACGEFEAGDHEDGVTEHINIFSHCIFELLKDDPVKIYPLKAETWAIYVDWYQKMKGKQDTATEGHHLRQPFLLVEILEDYSEEQGIATVRLSQAPGFSTVFHRQECSGAIKRFSPSELPAFSHRILSAKVPTDLGIHGEAWELDPASLPESMILTSTCTL